MTVIEFLVWLISMALETMVIVTITALVAGHVVRLPHRRTSRLQRRPERLSVPCGPSGSDIVQPAADARAPTTARADDSPGADAA